MRRRTALTLALACLATAVPTGLPAAAAAPVPEKCDTAAGSATVAGTWPQNRLNFTRAWTVTRGRGVTVAVVDSGLNTQFSAQLGGIDTRPGRGVIGLGFDPADTRDCYGHGTAVTSLLAAPPTQGTAFVGIAPDVTVVPIKQTNTQQDKTGTSEGIGRGIDAALAAGAEVINVSITTPQQTTELRDAVRRAAAKDVVIVAAAGNDGENQNLPAYPAAYSTAYPNVIAVSASDQADQIAAFSETGSYVTVAAPGVKVPTAAGHGGFTVLDGTSFATPYVAGTVALLRSAFPKMTAGAVRSRITATADAPPASVPDRRYGYGIVNPYLAVTSVRVDAPVASPSQAAAPLPAPPAAASVDRSLQHRALAVALALLALAAASVVVMSVLRARRRTA